MIMILIKLVFIEDKLLLLNLFLKSYENWMEKHQFRSLKRKEKFQTDYILKIF